MPWSRDSSASCPLYPQVLYFVCSDSNCSFPSWPRLSIDCDRDSKPRIVTPNCVAYTAEIRSVHPQVLIKAQYLIFVETRMTAGKPLVPSFVIDVVSWKVRFVILIVICWLRVAQIACRLIAISKRRFAVSSHSYISGDSSGTVTSRSETAQRLSRKILVWTFPHRLGVVTNGSKLRNIWRCVLHTICHKCWTRWIKFLSMA